MKRLKTLRRHFPTGVTFVLVVAVICALSIASTMAGDSKPKKKKEKKKLTGQELYSMHCSRCHPERYATERTETQWKTIVMHMRVRANLPAAQAKTILKYLQEESGN